jgi:imidazolonepropionase
MFLLKNISEMLTLSGAAQKEGRKVLEQDLDLRKNHSVICDKGRIVWMGPARSVPKEYAKKINTEYDMKGFTALPGFVECHTHTVFAGSRSHEFEMRQFGVSYQEIAAKGGGILSTVRQTRKASLQELLNTSQSRVDKFVQQGVTTLEIKSGYALDFTNELKTLAVIKKLKGPKIVATFLGAHDLPPEYSNHRDYLNFLIKKALPEIKKKKLAKRVDIFIEKGFFESDLAAIYLKSAQKMGFDIVVHADQLTHSGGTQVALSLEAISADHLLQINSAEIKALAQSNVTSVLLPTSDLYMKKRYPPARQLIDQGARVALATDFNPGSSPSQDLALTGLLARLEMKMSLPEVISAYTVGAAHALKLAPEVGSIEVGKSADFACTRKSWTDLFYSVGDLAIDMTIVKSNAAHCEI